MKASSLNNAKKALPPSSKTKQKALPPSSKTKQKALPPSSKAKQKEYDNFLKETIAQESQEQKERKQKDMQKNQQFAKDLQSKVKDLFKKISLSKQEQKIEQFCTDRLEGLLNNIDNEYDEQGIQSLQAEIQKITDTPISTKIKNDPKLAESQKLYLSILGSFYYDFETALESGTNSRAMETLSLTQTNELKDKLIGNLIRKTSIERLAITLRQINSDEYSDYKNALECNKMIINYSNILDSIYRELDKILTDDATFKDNMEGHKNPTEKLQKNTRADQLRTYLEKLLKQINPRKELLLQEKIILDFCDANTKQPSEEGGIASKISQYLSSNQGLIQNLLSIKDFNIHLVPLFIALLRPLDQRLYNKEIEFFQGTYRNRETTFIKNIKKMLDATDQATLLKNIQAVIKSAQQCIASSLSLAITWAKSSEWKNQIEVDKFSSVAHLIMSVHKILQNSASKVAQGIELEQGIAFKEPKGQIHLDQSIYTKEEQKTQDKIHPLIMTSNNLIKKLNTKLLNKFNKELVLKKIFESEKAQSIFDCVLKAFEDKVENPKYKNELNTIINDPAPYTIINDPAPYTNKSFQDFQDWAGSETFYIILLCAHYFQMLHYAAQNDLDRLSKNLAQEDLNALNKKYKIDPRQDGFDVSKNYCDELIKLGDQRKGSHYYDRAKKNALKNALKEGLDESYFKNLEQVKDYSDNFINSLFVFQECLRAGEAKHSELEFIKILKALTFFFLSFANNSQQNIYAENIKYLQPSLGYTLDDKEYLGKVANLMQEMSKPNKALKNKKHVEGYAKESQLALKICATVLELFHLTKSGSHEPLNITESHEPLNITESHEPLNITESHEPLNITEYKYLFDNNG
jgi:hypothetical protein